MIALVYNLLFPVAMSLMQPNVIYILSDDMRADLGIYGRPVVMILKIAAI